MEVREDIRAASITANIMPLNNIVLLYVTSIIFIYGRKGSHQSCQHHCQHNSSEQYSFMLQVGEYLYWFLEGKEAIKAASITANIIPINNIFLCYK